MTINCVVNTAYVQGVPKSILLRDISKTTYTEINRLLDFRENSEVQYSSPFLRFAFLKKKRHLESYPKKNGKHVFLLSFWCSIKWRWRFECLKNIGVGRGCGTQSACYFLFQTWWHLMIMLAKFEIIFLTVWITSLIQGSLHWVPGSCKNWCVWLSVINQKHFREMGRLFSISNFVLPLCQRLKIARTGSIFEIII